MNPIHDFQRQATRRTFLGATAGAIGQTALSSLLASALPRAAGATGSATTLPHFPAKAKRVLCLY